MSRSNFLASATAVALFCRITLKVLLFPSGDDLITIPRGAQILRQRSALTSTSAGANAFMASSRKPLPFRLQVLAVHILQLRTTAAMALEGELMQVMRPTTNRNQTRDVVAVMVDATAIFEFLFWHCSSETVFRVPSSGFL